MRCAQSPPPSQARDGPNEGLDGRIDGPKPAWPSPAPASTSAEVVVLDTNAWLDLWYFGDCRAAALRADFDRGRLRWLATARMIDELHRVLARPALQARPVAGDAAALALAQSARAERCEPPKAIPWQPSALRCRDAADQIFVDLALERSPAWLVTRDRALLKMARALSAQGVRVVTPADWPVWPSCSARPSSPA